jgi:hypothetical protein
MTRRPTALVAAMAFVLIVSAGEQVHARQKNESYLQHHAVGASAYAPVYQDRKHPGPGRYKKAVRGKKAKAIKRTAARHHARPAVTRYGQTYADITPRILPHPAGCPPRAFCGCGTAQRLLGKTVRTGGLAIAANWGGFPSTACAPGMAAWRPGHVYAIEQCLPGNRVVAYDPNSGRGLTRLHVRSLAGYRIVNPHGAYTEVNGKPGRVYRSRYAKRHLRRYASR